MFEPKRLPLRAVAPLSLSFCGYVVFNNLSLLLNPVGLYQSLKILVTPAVALIEVLFYGRRLPARYVLSLLVVCVGVAICTVTSFSVGSLSGLIVGAASVVSTSLYQVWSGRKQKALACNSSQLLLYQVPMSLAVLLFVFPFFDAPSAILAADPDRQVLGLLLLTCFLAFFVNLSIFLVIARTNAITYNVASQVKTILNYVVSFTVFHEPATPRMLVGIAMTLCGIFVYTYLKLADAEREKTSLPKKSDQVLVGTRAVQSQSISTASVGSGSLAPGASEALLSNDSLQDITPLGSASPAWGLVSGSIAQVSTRRAEQISANLGLASASISHAKKAD
jgi:solute carrier family 35 protein E3